MSNIKDLKKYFLLLQINDSAFPIGGYSHSYGLETYIQKGIVHDCATAKEYITKRLQCNLLYTDIFAARLAYDAARQGNVTALDQLEDTLEAARAPQELREASRKLGSRFIKTLLHITADIENQQFEAYLKLRQGKTISHPCAYGVFCACAEIERAEALSCFLYAQVSAMVTNCVKTIPLSQSDGQRLLYSLESLLAQLLEIAVNAEEEMFCMSAPAFDLRSMQHEHLYSRLYMS